MATLYPGAEYRPLGLQTQPLMAGHDVVCVHTMVGSLVGTDAYFRKGGYDGDFSHFGVGHDGTVYQWQDLEHAAAANYQGNARIISIETADTGPGFSSWSGSDVPAWLPAQLEALTGLIAWLTGRYDIPCVAVPDSRAGRRGVAWHRIGIDPWRVPDGVRWSTSRGKACPGDRRIAQMPALIAAAAAGPQPALEEKRNEDAVLIPLQYFDDDWRPDPGGLNFRASCPAETAPTSQVIDRAWVRWVVYWGTATWKVVAWDGAEDQGGKPIAEADPKLGWWELPPEVRGFTVEGRRSVDKDGKLSQPSVLLLSTSR